MLFVPNTGNAQLTAYCLHFQPAQPQPLTSMIARKHDYWKCYSLYLSTVMKWDLVEEILSSPKLQ